jgi:hypothetical protein
MKKSIIISVSIGLVILISIILFFTLNKKNTPETKTTAKTTKASKKIELSADEKPYISLIPTADGHTLSLKITQIPPKFTSIDYELIYTAKDENIEIEKGVSGTIKNSEYSSAKDLLLGTASCTNGCKYKYDEGVTGGILTLTLTTDNKEYVAYETPFVLTNSADINKEKKLTLVEENFIINTTVTSKSDFFIALKNFQSLYSVFSSGNGKGKITSIEPTTVTKTDLTSITGDYTITQ